MFNFDALFFCLSLFFTNFSVFGAEQRGKNCECIVFLSFLLFGLAGKISGTERSMSFYLFWFACAACNWMRRQLFKLNELHLCDKINSIQSSNVNSNEAAAASNISNLKERNGKWRNGKEREVSHNEVASSYSLTLTSVRASTIVVSSRDLLFLWTRMDKQSSLRFSTDWEIVRHIFSLNFENELVKWNSHNVFGDRSTGKYAILMQRSILSCCG